MSRKNQHTSRRIGSRGKKFLLLLEGSVSEPIYFSEIKNFYPKIKGILEFEKGFASDIDKMFEFAKTILKKKRKSFELPIDKVFIVIDRDHFENEKGNGIGLQKLKDIINKLSNEKQIDIILTAPRFEYWLYLHFKKERPSSTSFLIAKLEKLFKENHFISPNSEVIRNKNERETKQMLNKLITSGKLAQACNNAKEISNEYLEEILENRCPHTCIHNIIEYLEIL